MYEMTKVLDPDKGVSCVFRQPRAQSHCRLAHGYDLRFSITLGAHDLDANGWVYDFGGISILKQKIFKTFDHKWIIGLDDPEYGAIVEFVQKTEAAELTVLPRTGCEFFAGWLAAEAADMLATTGDLGRVRVISATCSEHGANHATYRVPYNDMESGNAWHY